MAEVRMGKYTHLFFDLDHTLWDYNRNAAETLEELYDEYNLQEFTSVVSSRFIEEFFRINNDLWNKFHRNEIPKTSIRNQRFQMLGDALSIEGFDNWDELQEDFITNCPKKGYVFPGAIDTLETLQGNFEMNLITNGFLDIQKVKLEYSGLKGFFEHTITSEIASSQKPQPEIFHFAFERSNAIAENSLMIGDDQHSDIHGAREVNMDQVLFNPDKHTVRDQPTYEIQHLSELVDILL